MFGLNFPLFFAGFSFFITVMRDATSTELRVCKFVFFLLRFFVCVCFFVPCVIAKSLFHMSSVLKTRVVFFYLLSGRVVSLVQ